MRYALLAAALVLPASAGAQVTKPVTVRSDIALPNKNGKGGVNLKTPSTAARLGLAVGDVLNLCPGLPDFTYAVNGAECPKLRKPMVTVDGTPASVKKPLLSWPKLAALSATNDITVNGLTYRIADGVAQNTVVDGLYADRLFREGVRYQGNSYNNVLRNFRFLKRQDAGTYSPNLPEGIDISGGHGFLIEDGEVGYMKMVAKSKEHPLGQSYPNGDGSNVEHDVYDVTYNRVWFHDMSDSGFDWLKGRQLRANDSITENNARGVKSGAFDAIMTNVLFKNNRTQVEFHGGDLMLVNPTFDNTGRTSKTWMVSASAGKSGTNTITMTGCKLIGPLKPTKDSIVLGLGSGVKTSMDQQCKDMFGVS